MLNTDDKKCTFKLHNDIEVKLSQEEIQMMIEKLENAGVDMQTIIKMIKSDTK